MKYNKSIFMTFIAGTNQAQVTIQVPFVVSSIHCHNVGYNTGTAPAAGTAVYGFVSSDLTGNQPLAMIYQDSTYPLSNGIDILYENLIPQPVNGSYTFQLTNFEGQPLLATVGNDTLGLILEFNS